MHKGSRGSALAPNPTLQNVKWRFLSDAALGPTARPQAYPDDSKKRISHLERALASTHDLEAQYQSFLQEVSKIDPSGTTFDGVGPGWAGVPSLGPSHPSTAGGSAALSADIIPSDPPDEPSFEPGGRGGRSGAGSAAVANRAGVGAASEAAQAPAAPAEEGGAPGEFASEDDEVARVQMLAAQAAADDNDDPLRNSPSPVIIWRHAAPVKIATNVPADLLGGPLGGGGGGDGGPVLGGGSVPGGGRPRLGGGGTSGGGHGVPPPRYVNPARAAYDRRMAYGVWYLPKEQWEPRAMAAGAGGLASAALGDPTLNTKSGGGQKAAGAGSEAGAADGGADGQATAGRGRGSSHGRRDRGGAAASKDRGGGGSSGGGGEEGEGQSLADQIPTLYSSRIYKDFLKAQKIPANRIPQYLQRVESPKEQKSSSAALSSRDRGKIPMMEGEQSMRED